MPSCPPRPLRSPCLGPAHTVTASARRSKRSRSLRDGGGRDPSGSAVFPKQNRDGGSVLAGISLATVRARDRKWVRPVASPPSPPVGRCTGAARRPPFRRGSTCPAETRPRRRSLHFFPLGKQDGASKGRAAWRVRPNSSGRSLQAHARVTR